MEKKNKNDNFKDKNTNMTKPCLVNNNKDIDGDTGKDTGNDTGTDMDTDTDLTFRLQSRFCIRLFLQPSFFGLLGGLLSCGPVGGLLRGLFLRGQKSHRDTGSQV